MGGEWCITLSLTATQGPILNSVCQFTTGVHSCKHAIRNLLCKLAPAQHWSRLGTMLGWHKLVTSGVQNTREWRGKLGRERRGAGQTVAKG